jgi:hypothetical protein
LKYCGWKEVPNLKQFQVLPRDAKPLAQWRAKDEYWRAVADGIQEAITKLRQPRADRRALGTHFQDAAGIAFRDNLRERLDAWRPWPPEGER